MDKPETVLLCFSSRGRFEQVEDRYSRGGGQEYRALAMAMPMMALGLRIEEASQAKLEFSILLADAGDQIAVMGSERMTGRCR